MKTPEEWEALCARSRPPITALLFCCQLMVFLAWIAAACYLAWRYHWSATGVVSRE